MFKETVAERDAFLIPFLKLTIRLYLNGSAKEQENQNQSQKSEQQKFQCYLCPCVYFSCDLSISSMDCLRFLLSDFFCFVVLWFDFLYISIQVAARENPQW